MSHRNLHPEVLLEEEGLAFSTEESCLQQNGNCHIPSCHREHTHKPRSTNFSLELWGFRPMTTFILLTTCTDLQEERKLSPRSTGETHSRQLESGGLGLQSDAGWTQLYELLTCSRAPVYTLTRMLDRGRLSVQQFVMYCLSVWTTQHLTRVQLHLAYVSEFSALKPGNMLQGLEGKSLLTCVIV